eukprot:2011795-Rhodomonas_salina.1
MMDGSSVPQDEVHESEDDWSCSCPEDGLGCVDIDVCTEFSETSSSCLSDEIIAICHPAESGWWAEDFSILATEDSSQCQEHDFLDLFFPPSRSGGLNIPLSEDEHADTSYLDDQIDNGDCETWSRRLPRTQRWESDCEKQGVKNDREDAEWSKSSTHAVVDWPWQVDLSGDSSSPHLEDQPQQTKRRKGKTRSKNHTKHDKSILLMWYMENLHNPFPREQDKVELAKLTSMTPIQVSTWFVNQRKRSPYRKVASLACLPSKQRAWAKLPPGRCIASK